MGIIKDNSGLYRPGKFDRNRTEQQFQIFLAKVVTVDYERKVLTLEDTRDQSIYMDVLAFPAHYSSYESSDVTMPEQGTHCVCAHLWYERGSTSVVILSYTLMDTITGQDSIAIRPIENNEIQGWSDRIRGGYRKAYPAQRATIMTGGFSEKLDTGWDTLTADFSRDRVDAERRTRTQITGRRVGYTDAGLSFSGPINRPNASNLTPAILPDGSSEYIVYLQPGAQLQDRYVSGKPDVIPFAEHTDFVQEYSLDYPMPAEIIQTTLFDTILGTIADPWARTTVTAPSGQTAYDSETFMVVNQGWDNPINSGKTAVGPTLNEGPTPQRRAFIKEAVAGTLVGYNRFDTMTYGYVLKPTLSISATTNVSQGRFGADISSGYLPVVDSPDHVEARLAASACATRFPFDQNTTRFDITKEGLLTFEIGATLPKENIPLNNGTTPYEYPHGAGRSVEAHLVGSMKMVVGKNRDEEDAIDLQALGQAVIRLGADDTALPNARRTVLTQLRSKSDAPQARQLQYWTASGVKLKPGDSGVNMQGYNKTGAESVSLTAAFDGAAVLRLGARNPAALRRHLVNGYKDGPGVTPYAVGDASRIDSHSPGRPNYGAGDSKYALSGSSGNVHDLTQAGLPQLGLAPFNAAAWSGTPVPGDSNLTNSPMDQHGLSLDLHAVRDILVRVGGNPISGQSILLDTAGGLVATIGSDKQGRSLTATFDGGVEIVIKANNQGKALRIELEGDIDISHKGNLHYNTTGDWITECTSWRHVSKTDRVFTQQKSIDASLTRHTVEAPDILNNQGTQNTAGTDENS
jgi:hypothetical protein